VQNLQFTGSVFHRTTTIGLTYDLTADDTQRGPYFVYYLTLLQSSQ